MNYIKIRAILSNSEQSMLEVIKSNLEVLNYRKRKGIVTLEIVVENGNIYKLYKDYRLIQNFNSLEACNSAVVTLIKYLES